LTSTELSLDAPLLLQQIRELGTVGQDATAGGRTRIALTDAEKAGRDLLVRARLIIARLEEFEASVGELGALERGRLVVGMSGPHLVMPLIASFVTAHPSIVLETRIGNTSTLLDDVAQCRIDVGIVALTEALASVACTRIADLRLALCVRRGDPMARRQMVRGDQIGGLQFIMRERGSITRVVAERVFAAARVAPVTRFEVTGREAMKEAIVAGLGAAEEMLQRRVRGVRVLRAVAMASQADRRLGAGTPRPRRASSVRPAVPGSGVDRRQAGRNAPRRRRDSASREHGGMDIMFPPRRD